MGSTSTPSPGARPRDWILHLDLDQFIAAVEVLRRPELAGLPVIVGGRGDPTERAVVSTASYEARVFGVGSGMPLRLAARKVPDAVILPVDAPAYAEASEQVMEALRGLGVVVEVLGWDEERIKQEVDLYVGRVDAERRSQEQPDDEAADEVRRSAPDIYGATAIA